MMKTKTVGEVIALLSKFDRNAPVYVLAEGAYSSLDDAMLENDGVYVGPSDQFEREEARN